MTNTIDFEMQQFTAGDVAAAIGVPLDTLRRWTQRGHVPNVQEESGSWRKYSLLDAAYIAALSSLATHMDPMRASMIMAGAVYHSNSSASTWLESLGKVKLSIKESAGNAWEPFAAPKGIYVLVTECREAKSTKSALYAGDNLQAYIEHLGRPANEGSTEQPRPMPTAHVAAYNVCPAIWAAMSHLTKL